MDGTGNWVRPRDLVIALLFGAALIAIGALTMGPSQLAGQTLLATGSALFAAAAFAFLAVPRNLWAAELQRNGVIEVFSRRLAAFSDADWEERVREARHHIRILGGSNHGYIGRDGAMWATTYQQTFKALVDRGVHVEVLWNDPTKAAAEASEREERRRARADAVESMEHFLALKESLPERVRDQLVLREYDDPPSCGLVWIDDKLVVSHYLPGRPHFESPGLVLAVPSANWLRTGVRGVRRRVTGPQAETICDVYTSTYQQICSSERTRLVDRPRVDALKKRDFPSEFPSEADIRSQQSARDASTNTEPTTP